MVKYLVIAAVLVGCKGGDKCERAWDKMAGAMKAEAKGGKEPDKAEMVGKCKDELKQHPEREAMLDCVIAIDGEVSMDKLAGCASAKGASGKNGDSPHTAGRKTEATLMLNKIGKNAKRVFGEIGAFPTGKVGLSPATVCCSGQGAKCPVDAKAWADPVWQNLEFTIDEPHSFQYTYQGDGGKTFTATAVGDLDCDTNMITYKLEGSVDPSGNPTVKLSEPTTED
jgi:hypothetical protein